MTLIKLNESHYIIVDESKQPVEGYYYDNFIKDIRDTSGAEYGQADHCWQITHSTKAMYKDEYISLSEVKELLGECIAEEKAVEWYNGHPKYDSSFIADPYSYKEGYNQALEDNKDKVYTEEDMRKAYVYGWGTDSLYMKDDFEEYIQSLQPPTSWDVEFVDGKLKLIEIVKNK